MRFYKSALVLAMILCLLCGCGETASTLSDNGTGATESSGKSGKMENILIIGDSNTEYCHITGQMESIIERKDDGRANGYQTLSDGFAGIRRNGVLVKNDNGWEKFDMTEQKGITILSPSGLWIKSNKANAVATVKFNGTGVDIYYCKTPSGGDFTVESDSGTVDVSTASDKNETAKISVTGLEDGFNKVRITAKAASVVLQGFVPHGGESAQIVHNWGNAGATTPDFARMDEDMFVSAIRALNPDKVVILLGTNDYFPAEEEIGSFETLIGRVKKGVPDAGILLTSTFDIDWADGKKWMAVYLKDVFPVVAESTGCTYWNMHDWYGDYDASRMIDGWHCSDMGGRQIAEEMLKQLEALK